MSDKTSEFDGIPTDVMTKEFAIAVHKTLGKLFEIMLEQSESDDPCPPSIIIATPGGTLVVGTKTSLMFSMHCALKSNEFNNILLPSMINEISEMVSDI
jgi:hypothetical protein